MVNRTEIQNLNCKAQKGTTLAEVLVASAILLLLLGMLYDTLIPTIKIWHKVEAETSTQQQAMLGISKVFREIVYSNSNSLTVLNNGYKAISFISLEELQVSGSPILDSDMEDTGYDADPITWKKFVIFYKENDTIKRKEIPFNNSSQVKRIKEDSLKNIVDNVKYSNFPVKIVARDIETVDFATPDYPSIDIEIKSKIPYGNKTAQTTLYIKLLPKN